MRNSKVIATVTNTIIAFNQDKLVFRIAKEINEINNKVANSLNNLNLKSLIDMAFSLIIVFRIFWQQAVYTIRIVTKISLTFIQSRYINVWFSCSM